MKKNWIEFELDYQLCQRVPMQKCSLFLRLLCSPYFSSNIILFNRETPSSFVLRVYPVSE